MKAKNLRVFVSGIGAVSPLAPTWAETWPKLLRGESAVGKIQNFDAGTFETRMGAEVPDPGPQAGDPSEGHESGKAIRLALKAAQEALVDAHLPEAKLQGARVGVFLGSGLGQHLVNQGFFYPLLKDVLEGEDLEAEFCRRVESSWDPRRSRWAAPEGPALALARHYGIEGLVRTHLTACAASAQALGEAAWAIHTGEIDVALAGGCHAMVHPEGVLGFSRLGALSTRNDEASTASRPFDATRDGFLMGEGSAILVLESEAHLEARGAARTPVLEGFGVTADAYRVTDPDPGATQVARAMRRAIECAGLDPTEIDYVNAHGTSTSANDATETRALKEVFQEHAAKLPVSSIKSMLGHLIAAAGAMEAAATVSSIRAGMVPPTMHLEHPDPDCDLDYVPGEAREVTVRHALSNSFGFGGQNVCLVFGRP